MLKKNDKHTAEITAISSEGLGIARIENMAVFVPGTAIGDVIEMLIVKVLKNFAFGKVLNIVEKSPHRIESDCEVFGRCGGCQYRHINTGSEANIKQQRVQDAIKRIAKLDLEVLPIITDQNRCGYRNKAQYPIGINKQGEVITGFYSLHSHNIVPTLDCKLQPIEFENILKTCIAFFNNYKCSVYNQETNSGQLRHIYLRKAENTGEIMLCLVINSQTLKKEQKFVEHITNKHPEITSLLLNINTEKTNVILGKQNRTLFGQDFITDKLCDLKFKISANSFYQVNTKMTEILYNTAKEYANPKDQTVLDLYCGAGTIGLSMASEAKSVIGIEIIEQAVNDANFNASQNNIKNASFICADANEGASQIKDKCDVVIVDPPRKGLPPELITLITKDFTPNRVVYVSCDPATLARDLKLFEEGGYKTQKIQPVDMFPATSHVECVVLMSRV